MLPYDGVIDDRDVGAFGQLMPIDKLEAGGQCVRASAGIEVPVPSSLFARE
jgi:hypothetical protein